MGFDNECILNIQSLAGEYFCPVCRLLVYPNEALQSQCTHLYCKPCLTYVVGTTQACPYDGYLVTEADSKPLTESNKALAETIGKVAVHCLYHRSGCTWQGPLSDCTSHCSGCAFGNSPVVCNRCGIQIVHSQVQEHAQNCPGVPSQTQQTEGVQEAAAAGVTLSTDQNHGAIQVGTTTSQVQTSQTTAATTPAQDLNKQANPNPQAQAVQAAVPTPEQLYQQQQQYQQYYQQYPGYDPYQQQYQQYYPFQQQVVQQYQQQPAHVPGQQVAQAYVQSQPQPQPQAQPQPQTQPQPQPQVQPHVQAPAAAQLQNHQVNPPQQLHPAVHPHSQIQPQSHPPAHVNPPPQPQLYPQAQPHLQSQPMQPHPQSYAMQPHPQQVLQIPQYQQPHSQMQQPQTQIQPQPHSQQHPLPQPTPHSQTQPQSQLQHHPQPQPQLHPSQPHQPPHNVQPQVQHQSAQAVSGHQSYQQPQPQQQMQLIPPQQHPMVMHPHSAPNQQPQHPVQMQTQFPQQPAQMRPPQSHAPIPNQQPPSLLPISGHGATIPSAQQQQLHPNAHQPGHPVHQRPVMHPNQQPTPQQYVQQQQFPFPGQPTGSVQNQLHQQGAFYQQQQQLLPMQSQLRPQAPSSMQQHSSAHPQPTAAFSLGTQPYQSQNHVGRPMIPNHGGQLQPFPQSPGGLGGATQVRPMQLGANQQSMTQNYPIRTNSQSQALSEQQSSNSQNVLDQLSQKIEGGGEVERSSQKTTKNDANYVIASGSGEDSVEGRTVKYENDRKPTNIEDENVTGQPGRSAGEIAESVRMPGMDSELNALEKKDPVIKHVVKEEASEGALEPLAGGKSVGNVGEDQKDVTDISLIQVEQHSLKEKESQEQAENLEEQSRKLHKDPLDNGRIAQPFTGDDKNTKSVPAADSSFQIPGKNLPPSQVARGPMQPSHPVPTDQGKHQPPPTHYGPSAPSMLHAVPPGPPHHVQGPGLPPYQLRPQGPGYLGQTGQPLNHPDHFQPLGRGPSHSGPPQRTFELQSVAPQELYNQGRMAPPHAGAPRTSLGESVGGPLMGVLPPAPFDPHSGMMARAPPHGPEGLMGQQRPNPLDAEMFLSQRRGNFDGRQPDLHHPGSLERAPFAQTSGGPSSMTRLNGPPGLESSYAPGMRDDRFKPLPGEHMNPFPMEPNRRIERGEFEDDLKQFPRPSHLDADPKFGGYSSSSRPLDNRGPQAFGMDASRPFDMAPNGLNFDAGMKLDPSASAALSRNLPPNYPGSILRPNDTGERSRPVGFHEDNMGRPEFSHTRPDFLGPVPRYGRHHMDGSPVRDYPGLPSRGFGPGAPGVQSGLDIDGRETLRFGDRSKPFNLHSDPIGPFHETRFPVPPHLRRGELDGPLGMRINEMIGQDILPSHLRRDDPLGPPNFPSHLRLGEPGFGPFSGHARIGELAGPGKFPPRFGEPGFRSSYTLQDTGFFKGNMETFDNPRKRKPTSMGWCRLCKVDCETMEGLDLHSQTREHQDMAMEMVLNIKQQNAKKKKLISNDHSAAEDASKSKSASFENRRNRH